jgi:ketosteroid isomerase-like protein
MLESWGETVATNHSASNKLAKPLIRARKRFIQGQFRRLTALGPGQDRAKLASPKPSRILQVLAQTEAEELMDRVFDAWNARNIPKMLTYFCDDLIFVEHAGEGGTGFKVHHGASAFGEYLQTYLDVADCVSTVNFLTYDGIHIRTVIGFAVVHRKTNLKLVGRFRQVIRLRDGLISHLDEYHDLDASASFWKLTNE